MKQSPDISDFVKPGKASVIFDGQFGSTGKGLAGAWVGEHNRIDWSVTNASANAGHTSIIDGTPVILFHIPSTWLTAHQHHDTKIYIDAGAIVNLDVLVREIEELGIEPNQIFVNPNAAIILEEDIAAETDVKSSQTKIASTQKGVGASLARKIRREGPNLGQWLERNHKRVPFKVGTVSINSKLIGGESAVIEVPQGFSLSLNSSGFYPYTTSRDCTLQQGLSDAGVHPKLFHKSMSVIRTLPIRVGNIMDGKRQVGFSGHVYPDQRETSWEELGMAVERTTVTKRIRRVFTFSQRQFKDMLVHSMPDVVFLNFCNYLVRNKLENLVDEMMQTERSCGIRPLHYYGFGAASHDVREYI